MDFDIQFGVFLQVWLYKSCWINTFLFVWSFTRVKTETLWHYAPQLVWNWKPIQQSHLRSVLSFSEHKVVLYISKSWKVTLKHSITQYLSFCQTLNKFRLFGFILFFSSLLTFILVLLSDIQVLCGSDLIFEMFGWRFLKITLYVTNLCGVNIPFKPVLMLNLCSVMTKYDWNVI